MSECTACNGTGEQGVNSLGPIRCDNCNGTGIIGESKPESTPDIATTKETLDDAINADEISIDEAEKQKQELEEPKEFSEENEDGTTTGYHMD